MATVFMRWLESTPRRYDRGIRLLTLGRLARLKRRIVECLPSSAGEGPLQVLEIGCGTGSLAVMMASAGAHVTGIDASAGMLAQAERRVREAGLEDRVELQLMDVAELPRHLEPQRFDVVVGTLVFSELSGSVQRYALNEVSRVLKPGGSLLIADEVVPGGWLRRLIYWTIRFPLLVLTWLLTRTTTSPVSDLPQMIRAAGFRASTIESALGGSLVLLEARLAAPDEGFATAWEGVPRLRHRISLKTVLLDLWCLFNRLIPPYPKKATGLYRIGQPDRTAPVLVTGNYDLTVRRLVGSLDGRTHCWLLVCDSKGINVWCSAGGGFFTASAVVRELETSGVKDLVDHHTLILPQLCANGVDGWEIRKRTGWGVHWGPARAVDVPAYIEAGFKKTDRMRQVSFPLKDRLEMTTTVMVFYALLILIVSVLLWRSQLPVILGATIALSYVYGVFLPWLPGKDGVGKGVVLAALALAGLWTWSYFWGHLKIGSLFNWSLGLGFLAFFVGAEFQGMSPQMRGEQANWRIEGLVGVGVLAVYGLGRLVLGG